MNKKTFYVREKGWYNFMPVVVGYDIEEEMVVFPSCFPTIQSGWHWLWRLLFTNDFLIITGGIPTVEVTFEEEDQTCGLD